MSPVGILDTLQRLATSLHRLDELTDDVRTLRNTMTSRADRLEQQVGDLRERLARLEASREADRAVMQADLARFKADVERAELRLTKGLSHGQSLPNQGDRE